MKTPITDAACQSHFAHDEDPDPAQLVPAELCRKFESALQRIATTSRDVTGGPEMVAIAKEALGMVAPEPEKP